MTEELEPEQGRYTRGRFVQQQKRNRQRQERLDISKAKTMIAADQLNRDRAQCEAFRVKMRKILDVYAKVIEQSTDLGELQVWAAGCLTIIEVTEKMDTLSANWKELRLAFGHDSKTVTRKSVGHDFDNRLARALEEHNALELKRLEDAATH